FSLLWSEHCGYKHSALLLKRFPTSSPRVLQGPGENAGVVDLGDGEAVAFKVESHNHPSAVEPFQGAATGIGGILRDVIAMGARPGPDGIGGAGFRARQMFGYDAADKRPSGRSGGPSTSRKLVESSLELVERDLAVSLQDC